MNEFDDFLCLVIVMIFYASSSSIS